MCLCCFRPPGHHAEKNFPMGFCIFNNVCILAKYAQMKYNINRSGQIGFFLQFLSDVNVTSMLLQT